MHTQKMKNPLSTLTFLVMSEMPFAYSRKRTKILYMEASPGKKKSCWCWVILNIRLSFSVCHQILLKSWENHMIPDSYKHASILVVKRDHTSFRHWLWKPRPLPDAFVLEVNPHSTEDREQKCPSSAEAVNSDVTSICEPPSSASRGWTKSTGTERQSFK